MVMFARAVRSAVVSAKEESLALAYAGVTMQARVIVYYE